MRDRQLSLALPGTGLRAESRELLRRLRDDARVIGAPFGLVPTTLAAEKDSATHYGICYADGRILVRLRHARTGRTLRYSSLVNTLCHELAHLEHLNHGEGFQALLARVLEHARAIGLYRPRSIVPLAGCGVVTPRARSEPIVAGGAQLLLAMPIPGRIGRRR